MARSLFRASKLGFFAPVNPSLFPFVPRDVSFATIHIIGQKKYCYLLSASPVG